MERLKKKQNKAIKNLLLSKENWYKMINDNDSF